MAAFTSPDPDDRTAFEQRWARLRSDASTTNRVVEIDGRVVGHIASFDLEGRREHLLDRPGRLGPRHCYACSTRVLAAGDNPSSLRWRCQRQRRVDPCVDEVRFPDRGRRARVRPWAQRGDGRGRAPTRCMTPRAERGRSVTTELYLSPTGFSSDRGRTRVSLHVRSPRLAVRKVIVQNRSGLVAPGWVGWTPAPLRQAEAARPEENGARREHSSRRCLLELGQPVAHPGGHNEVLLAFVALE